MIPDSSLPSGVCGRFLVDVDRRLRLARTLRVASWGVLAPVSLALVLLLFGLGRAATIAALAAGTAVLIGAFVSAPPPAVATATEPA